MAEVKKTKILNYINVFRGLAILLIVAGHTMQFGAKGSLARITATEIFTGGTALFIFISGFLFQHLSYKYEFKTYMKKKWTNVIMPYLYTAIPGILFCFLLPLKYGNSFDGLNYLLQIPMMLTVGRVHNTPAWFIPMIILFFLLSKTLLYLEKKNILYKLLPVMFLITIFMPRHDVDYNSVMGLSYADKYLEYLNYVFMGFVHFFSMYVFGMFCSRYKEVIDKFYDKRFLYWLLMLLTSGADIYLSMSYGISNGTVSKIFLTILLLAYLKHYDEWIISHIKLNKALDVIAKYSFGIFFIHWYVFFVYNVIFDMPNVLGIHCCEICTLGIVFVRFFVVSVVSMLLLYWIKNLILKINPNANTRSFTGV